MKLEYRVDHNRTDDELEAFLMFCVAVAGKNADNTIVAVRRLIERLGRPGTRPLAAAYFYAQDNWEAGLQRVIKESGIGCYTSRCRSYLELAKATFDQENRLDLRTCTREDLARFHGIGYKTASMFILFTRPNPGNMAILDVHILRWLRDERGYADVPLQTPGTVKGYQRVESIFVREYKRSGFDGTLAEFDYHLWVQSRGGEGHGADHEQPAA